MATLPGVNAQHIETSRGKMHVLRPASQGPGPAVLLVHGNLSSSVFFEEMVLSLATKHQVYAPDLRGFGETAIESIDATRGVRDFSDDLEALVVALGIEGPIHLIGWSVGGAVVMQYALDYTARVGSLTLLNPMSPYGFGGTKDVDGTPCWDDFAGSGGGTANPEMLSLLKDKERSDEAPTSPRNILNQFYFKPPFRATPEREEAFLDSMFATKLSDQSYPGDMTASENWPTVAPGSKGMNNAISPKYCDVSGFSSIPKGPPVLWIRGADDLVVSDSSMFDFGTLGQLGAVPGWPGAEVFPPQPMLGQLRKVLDAYQKGGGRYQEVVIDGCGHSPHIEKPEATLQAIWEFWG